MCLISILASHPGEAPQEKAMSTVLLTNDTTGFVKGTPNIGDTVTVRTCDENGMPIEVKGTVKEVLEDE